MTQNTTFGKLTKGSLPDDEIKGIDLWAAGVQDELSESCGVLPRPWKRESLTLDIRVGHASLWIIAHWPDGGGTAFRAAYAPGAPLNVEKTVVEEAAFQCTLKSSLGRFEIEVSLSDEGMLHWQTRLTPHDDLLLPFWPRDISPLNGANDPRRARGTVHAGQPDSGAAMLFLTLTHPRSGSLLYLQNMTALNPLLNTVQKEPGCLVGGTWPQLGFALPASDVPLPAGKKVVISDAFVRFSTMVPHDEREAALLFLELLAGIYPSLPQPETQWHDWPQRAEATAKDLVACKDATVKDKGCLYVRPYLGAEYPDSMVQLAVLLPMREYEGWAQRKLPLAERLRQGIPTFFDPQLGTMRRYLPSVGEDKNADEVDSWYLYHPLHDLARLAGIGDKEAAALLLASVDYGIQIARHFHYRWPVQFDVKTRKVITGERKPGQPGQSDVGGLYAGVMLHCWDLTGNDQFLEEAKRAAQALDGYRFSIGYQFNITALAASACLRLWRITGDAYYRDQSYVLLASFFQHCTFFSSELGAARHFPTFLGVLCLHDADYMAIFEAFEAFAAFYEIFGQVGDDLPPSLQLLMAEYCRHLLNRAWYYYPSELPEEALASEVRNGWLDRTLAFPVEDLYSGGDPAGSVGQEIYGAGAAFAFVSRAFRRLPNVPFLIYCDYPIADISQDAQQVTLRLWGDPQFFCSLRLIPSGSLPLPSLCITISEIKEALKGEMTPEGHCEYQVPGRSALKIYWKEDKS